MSYSLCSVLLSPCILHACPRKCLHYKCDMLAYNDAQQSIWSPCRLQHSTWSSLRAFLEIANMNQMNFQQRFDVYLQVRKSSLLFYHFSLSGPRHLAPGKLFPNSARTQTKINPWNLLLFNFSVTTFGLKITNSCTHMLTFKTSFGWPVFFAPLSVQGARMTHRPFICSKCPLQQWIQQLAKNKKKTDQLLSCSSSALPCFYKGSKLSLTLHPSCDGSQNSVIQHVHSDGSLSIFLSLSCVCMCGTCRYCHFPR